MSKYLVPLDGSEGAERALDYAKVLAEKDGSSLHLLRTFPELATVYSFQDFASPEPLAYDLSGFLRHCESYLQSKADGIESLETEWKVEKGDAATKILELSSSDDCKGIVIASHGKGGIARWLLGSVTQKVLRAAEKPVFLVRSQDSEAPKIRKIFVGLDWSKLGLLGFEEAVKLARIHGAKIKLFTALEYAPYPVTDIGSALDGDLQELKTNLANLAKKHPDVEIETEVQVVEAVKGILESSKDCDLVVLTSHGMGGFERFLLGSATEKILHKGTKPTLVIPSRGSSKSEGES